MRHNVLALAAVAWLLHMGAAAACETIAAEASSPLEIRRPLLDDQTRVTAGFGMRNHPILAMPRMHLGVDWQASIGTPVIAVGRGRVVSAEREGAYGNRVIIDHGGPWQTVYAHLDSFAVREGDCVKAGTPIAMAGITGLVVGPVLHFEVRRDGQAVDPLILPTLGAQ